MPSYTASPAWIQIAAPSDAPLKMQNIDPSTNIYIALGTSAPQPLDVGLLIEPLKTKAIQSLAAPLWARTQATTNGPIAPSARVAVIPGLT